MMDPQVKNIRGLLEADLALLHHIEESLPITADVSRADILICCLLTDQHGKQAPTVDPPSIEPQASVVAHVMPHSMSSLYRQLATGRKFTEKDQPLILRALTNGSGGRRRQEVLRNGAPIIQDVYPIRNQAGRVIAALVVETNMFEYERQRRRNPNFRRAVLWLLEMCVRGEIEQAATLSRFGQYDGVYLVNRERRVIYMSGIATNLFRAVGVLTVGRSEHISILETADQELVGQAFEMDHCLEVRSESSDGRVWGRKVIPLHVPPGEWRMHWPSSLWSGLPRSNRSGQAEAVLVLVHNATETVQKQRELNVKSVIIQEVHHRVKNNLQNIAAILRIQARRCESEEAKQHLTDAVNRVLSMSVIHEFLSQDEHRAINLRDVCQRIANQVAEVSRNPEQEVEILIDGPNIRLPASQATPAAMVINELLLNAVEHGLGKRSRGAITITLSDLGDSVRLVVEDDGSGLPPNFNPGQSRSLGLQIVHTLVTDDLKGTLQMESVEAMTDAATPAASSLEGAAAPHLGARAIVTFPKRSLRVD
ncbi:MAG: sensor histidine kinase [Chloroflexi bacterium]|nr:sensor histidine kinase [Chloroflexota bacterium]